MEPVPPPHGPGRVILLNGASSSGKSTLAAALQAALDEPFLHVSSDRFVAAGMLPSRREDRGPFDYRVAAPYPAYRRAQHPRRSKQLMTVLSDAEARGRIARAPLAGFTAPAR